VSAPEWLCDLLGWKPATKKATARCEKLFGRPFAPNLADVGGMESLRIAGAAYEALGIVRVTRQGLDEEDAGEGSSGSALEQGIEADIRASLDGLDASRLWTVSRFGDVSRYSQFEHLKTLQALFEQQPALRATLGRDYQVRSDVYVGVEHPEDKAASPFLHAAAEPLPSRLISIARGTGEVDSVYHLLYEELAEAVDTVATEEQKAQWAEMVEQRRIRPYSVLARDLTLS
jgi:hypothetical protein